MTEGAKVFESRQIGEVGNDFIQLIKKRATELWETYDALPLIEKGGEAGRLMALAKTELESSVMWAVKSISRM